MPEDRRASIRRQATLPFVWREVAESATVPELCRTLGLPAALALQSRLAELDEEYQRLCASVADTRVLDVLRVLDRKVAALEEAIVAEAPQPERRPLVISPDGVGFDASERVPEGTWLALHVVLPVSYHVVCKARVSHCAAHDGGYRIGAEFHQMQAPAGRRLTRYAIGRDRDT